MHADELNKSKETDILEALSRNREPKKFPHVLVILWAPHQIPEHW